MNEIAISIIFPVCDEKEALPVFLDSLKKAVTVLRCPFELIAVDDDSKDGSAQILNSENQIRVIRNTSRIGYGASLKKGIIFSKGKVICIIDSDNSYSALEIHDLLKEISLNDMVVGARKKKEKNVDIFPFHQKIAKYFISSVLGLLFRKKIEDINSGFRLIKREAVNAYLPILPNGFSFTSSITLAMLFDSRPFVYVPISYSRRCGRSKVRLISYTYNFVKAFLKITLIKINEKLKNA